MTTDTILNYLIVIVSIICFGWFSYYYMILPLYNIYKSRKEKNGK